MTDATETVATPEAAPEEGRQSAPKYVGATVSMKQAKLWLVGAKKGPANCPKGSHQGQKHSERNAILDMLDLRKRARKSKRG